MTEANLPGTERRDTRSAALDTLSPMELARLMQTFSEEAVRAVDAALPALARAIEAVAARLASGGRMIYVGAGTSGRLGVMDASECPPTFGVPEDMVTGVIAGGDRALRHAVEGAEDDPDLAKADLARLSLGEKDAVVAVSASGGAPYCLGALAYAKARGALAISMACNENAPMSALSDIAIEAPTGAEALAGSTRLKAGTATKLMCNTLSTGVMTRLGKVYQNLMVDVRATNVKLRDRAERILMSATGLDRERARALLAECGTIKCAVARHETGASVARCREALAAEDGFVRRAIERIRRAGDDEGGTADGKV